MIYNFCTLFDKKYLLNGLALYYSLNKFNQGEFVLWMLCMDDVSYEILSKMNLSGMKLVKLADFENEALRKAKQDRNIAEYCWTCAANFCNYLLNKYDLPSITYLDSDLLFFGDFKRIFSEIGSNSIGIIEHRYSTERKYLEKDSGRFNVEWVTFLNDEEGKKALKWWSDKVIEWCYARFENGRFGDQMYLNDWPERFKNVCIIQNLGAGLAPWNVNNYSIKEDNGKILVNNQPLIFYHFHGFKLYGKFLVQRINGYYLKPFVIKKIYGWYSKQLRVIIKLLSQKYNFNINYFYTKIDWKNYFLEKIRSCKFSNDLLEMYYKKQR